MPIYEYECGDCRRQVSLLILRPSTAPPPTCPRCGGTSLTRLMSRFARIKSEDERLDALGDPASFGDFDENDPASVGRFMKKMGREFGDDLGDDFSDAMEESMGEAESEEHAEGLAESSAGPESGAGDDL